MKTHTLGIVALLSMSVVGTTVYAVTPAGGFGAKKAVAKTEAAATTSASAEAEREEAAQVEQAAVSKAQFSAGSTVRLDGRLGHAAMDASTPGNETFVLLELRGDNAGSGGEPARTGLSIVIDKSGSMTGSRLPNALLAAETAVGKLRDGDSVSIIAFDTKIETMLPQTVLNAQTRVTALEAIRKIHLGGDTCISCGLEEGLKELSSTATSNASVRRMLLLSDGKPTSGVRDESQFRSIAQRAMGRGVSITTVGVDVDFNEAVMTTIALGSNGRHYFVENDRDLPKVFETEAATLESSIAADAVAEIDLAPGIEFVQLYGRTFERNGSRITVPLGTFTKDEPKTVLVKVRLPNKQADSLDVADVRLTFKDLRSGKQTEERGKLAVELVTDKSQVSELDGVVLDRLQRSETAAALNDANALFNEGKTEQARQRLEAARNSLAANRDKAKTAAPAKRANDVDKSFDNQQKELESAQGGLAPPPAASAAPNEPGAAPRPAPPAPDARQQKAQSKRSRAAALPMDL